MSETTINIIIGALIGFIPSALIALVAHILQLGEKRKDRIRNVVETRINIVEEEINFILKFLTTLPQKTTVLLMDNYDDTDKLGYETYVSLISVFESMVLLGINCKLLKDKSLNDLATSFVAKSTDLLRPFSEASLETDRKERITMTKHALNNYTGKLSEATSLGRDLLLRLDSLRKSI